MPQFLLGLVFGSLFTGAELLGVMFLLPFLIAFFALVGWGLYEAVIWYDAASSAYEVVAWYAWPWHWPGAHLSKELFDTMGYGGSTHLVVSGDTDPILNIFLKAPRAVFAIFINAVVALLPLHLLGFGLQLVQLVRKITQRQETELQTSKVEK